ncbi:MAG TPA: phosphatidylglycerophosphatase A [Candidatus Acidoferrales bacterium]|jgi:phosphatidylglycerophosphatase A|nr:phosphatidylglycerophosphatase A [Candidatus Acidoferrales bacterium]
MSAKTDPASSDDPTANSLNEPLAVPPLTNPHFALLMATAGGLGYFPKAPGTLGSLVGLLLALLPSWIFFGLAAATVAATRGASIFLTASTAYFDPFLGAQIVLTLFIAALGVWASDRVSQRFREKDPQYVVIDEVSGQHLTLLLGCGIPVWWRVAESYWNTTPIGLITLRAALNWKYLLLGFILFRVFDIWKPFPARQAESLPGGWGIMADDWIAGIYAGIGLWLARAAGL